MNLPCLLPLPLLHRFLRVLFKLSLPMQGSPTQASTPHAVKSFPADVLLTTLPTAIPSAEAFLVLPKRMAFGYTFKKEREGKGKNKLDPIFIT